MRVRQQDVKGSSLLLCLASVSYFIERNEDEESPMKGDKGDAKKEDTSG